MPPKVQTGLFGSEPVGLVKKQDDDWTVYTPSNSGLLHYSILDVAVDKSGKVWIGTNKGLTVFNGQRWQTFKSGNSGLPDNSVGNIKIGPSGDKWLYEDNSLTIPSSIYELNFDEGVAVYSGSGISGIKASAFGVQKFRFYPNPAQNHVKLQLTGFHGKVQYQLTNTQGKLVKSKQVQGVKEKRINLEGLPTGVYFMHIRSNRFIKTRKLVVQ